MLKNNSRYFLKKNGVYTRYSVPIHPWEYVRKLKFKKLDIATRNKNTCFSYYIDNKNITSTCMYYFICVCFFKAHSFKCFE